MAAVNIAVLRYHLRFYPDAKHDTNVINTPNQFSQRAPQLLFVDLPVPQPAIVVIALTKPAVIHHHHVNAKRCRLLCQPVNRLPVKIKIRCLPAINQHRPGLPAVRSAADMFPDAAVVSFRQFRKALCGIAKYRFWYCQCLSLFQRIVE